MKRFLSTTSPVPHRNPMGYTFTATPEQLRRLGHAWKDIERWTMSGKVHWEPGEIERLIGKNE